MNYKEFYQLVKEHDLKKCFKILEYGSRVIKDVDNESIVYNQLWENIQTAIREEKEIGLELFIPLVDDVIAALSVFCALLDEYMEQAIEEDGYMPDGFVQ